MRPPRTPDGRWIVVDGRRWRASDPDLPDDVHAVLLHHLGVARSGVRTALRSGDTDAVAAARGRVDLAKRGLGERGEPWWEQDPETRRRRWTAALALLDPSPALARGTGPRDAGASGDPRARTQADAAPVSN